jgi:hypothetical protein
LRKAVAVKDVVYVRAEEHASRQMSIVYGSYTYGCQDIVKYDKQEMILDLDLKQMPAERTNVDYKPQTTAE